MKAKRVCWGIKSQSIKIFFSSDQIFFLPNLTSTTTCSLTLANRMTEWSDAYMCKHGWRREMVLHEGFLFFFFFFLFFFLVFMYLFIYFLAFIWLLLTVQLKNCQETGWEAGSKGPQAGTRTLGCCSQDKASVHRTPALPTEPQWRSVCTPWTWWCTLAGQCNDFDVYTFVNSPQVLSEGQTVHNFLFMRPRNRSTIIFLSSLPDGLWTLGGSWMVIGLITSECI